MGGSHYKVGGEEHWDRVARLGLDYFQAQITKYVERCHRKGGILDLKKAQHFLEKYIQLLGKEAAHQHVKSTHGDFCARCGEPLFDDVHAEPGPGYVNQDR